MVKHILAKPIQKGFSLIELAIAFAVMALLAGLALAGNHFIEASKINTVVSDLGKYKNVTELFKEKYSYLPGDMPTASSYWGAYTVTGSPPTAITGATSGNGDGKISSAEGYQFWRHLSLAKILDEQYYGDHSSGDFYIDGDPFPNSPGANLGTERQRYGARAMADGSTGIWGVFGNYLYIASVAGSGTPFTTQQAQAIDDKIDDGVPSKGEFMAASALNCTTTDDSTAGAADAAYKLSYKGNACNIYYWINHLK